MKQNSPFGVLATHLAIHFFHQTFFPPLKSPTESSSVKQVVIGIKRKFGKVVKKHKAMTPDTVKQVLVKVIGPGLSLLTFTELRFAAAVLVMYFDAMRTEELVE